MGPRPGVPQVRRAQERKIDMAKNGDGDGKKKTKREKPGVVATPLTPLIDNPGHKTTTVRFTNAQFDELDLFCRATNESMVEFIRQATDDRIRELAKDPKVVEAVERQINRFRGMLDRFQK